MNAVVCFRIESLSRALDLAYREVCGFDLDLGLTERVLRLLDDLGEELGAALRDPSLQTAVLLEEIGVFEGRLARLMSDLSFARLPTNALEPALTVPAS